MICSWGVWPTGPTFAASPTKAATYFDIKGVIANGQVTKVHADPQWRRVDVRIDRLVSFDFARLPEAGG
jgi:hypothetical protein